MTLINMDTVQFYQPAKTIGQSKDGQLTVSSGHVPTTYGKGSSPPALGLNKGWSGVPRDYDLIEIVDMTSPPPEEPFNPFQGPARDLDITEKDAQGTILCRCF